MEPKEKFSSVFNADASNTDEKAKHSTVVAPESLSSKKTSFYDLECAETFLETVLKLTQ